MTPEEQLKSQREMTLSEFIDLAGDKLGVPKPLRDAIFQNESNFNHYYPNGQVKRSPKGALGVGQLMPDTARKHKVDPLDPIDNAFGALKEQKELYEKYLASTNDTNKAALLAAAAYNAGPGAVDKYGTIPPYAETQNYVRKVAAHLKQNPITQNVLSEPLQSRAPAADRPPAAPPAARRAGPTTDPTQAEQLPVRPPKIVMPDPFAMPSVKEAQAQTYPAGYHPTSNIPARNIPPASPSINVSLPNRSISQTAGSVKVAPGGLNEPASTNLNRRPMLAPARRRPAPSAGELLVRTAIRNPEKLANDLRWHFGVNDPEELRKLPPATQRRMIAMATTAAAADERKRQQGIELRPSLEYQNQMRAKVGLGPNGTLATRQAAVPALIDRTIPDLTTSLVDAPLSFAEDRAIRVAVKKDEQQAREALKARLQSDPNTFGAEYEGYLRLNRTSDSPGMRADFLNFKVKQISALEGGGNAFGGGSARGAIVARDAEKARQQRVAQMGTVEYLAQAPKSAATGFTDAFATSLKGIAALAKKLDFSGEYKGKKTSDLATYELGEAIQRGMRDVLGSNEDLEQEFGVGQVPAVFGQVGQFMLGGWATKSPKVAAVILGSAMTAGDAYDEVRARGGSDEEAVNAALLAGGLLGPTELIGMRGAMKALEGTAKAATWRAALRMALREGRRDIIENALQEVGQEFGQGLITGNPRSLEQLLQAGLLGGIGGTATTPLTLVTSAPGVARSSSINDVGKTGNALEVSEGANKISTEDDDVLRPGRLKEWLNRESEELKDRVIEEMARERRARTEHGPAPASAPPESPSPTPPKAKIIEHPPEKVPVNEQQQATEVAAAREAEPVTVLPPVGVGATLEKPITPLVSQTFPEYVEQRGITWNDLVDEGGGFTRPVPGREVEFSRLRRDFENGVPPTLKPATSSSQVEAGAAPEKPIAAPASTETTTRSLPEIENEIQAHKSRLEREGFIQNADYLYDPDDSEWAGNIKSLPDERRTKWKPMPPELAALYREYEQAGRVALEQNINEISSSLKSAGIADKRDIQAVLHTFSLYGTNSFDQFLAGTETEGHLSRDPKDLLVRVYDSLAQARGLKSSSFNDYDQRIPYSTRVERAAESLKNSADSQTLQDASKAIRSVFSYFGIDLPVQPSAHLEQTPSSREGETPPGLEPRQIVRHSDPNIDGGEVIGRVADGRLKVRNKAGGISLVQDPRKQGNREAAIARVSSEQESSDDLGQTTKPALVTTGPTAQDVPKLLKPDEIERLRSQAMSLHEEGKEIQKQIPALLRYIETAKPPVDVREMMEGNIAKFKSRQQEINTEVGILTMRLRQDELQRQNSERVTDEPQTAVQSAETAEKLSEAKLGEKHPVTGRKFSSTQVDLPGPEASLQKQAAAAIPDSELAADGREDKPHVTVKYGLHSDDASELQKLLADEPPVKLKIGKVSIFPAKEGADYDVVKMDVDSPDLHRLNAKIAKAVPVTDTHPEYKPHVTLAYVKPGEGAKYVGQSNALTGREVTLDKILFSGRSGQEVEIPLTGVTAAAKPADVRSVKSGTYEARLEDANVNIYRRKELIASGKPNDKGQVRGITFAKPEYKQSAPTRNAVKRVARQYEKEFATKPATKFQQTGQRQTISRPTDTLWQFVQKRGGIAPADNDIHAGELARLTSKATGKIGLLNRANRQGNQRFSAEYMMDAANEAGYRDRNGEPFTSIGDFIVAVADDANGLLTSHSVEYANEFDYEAAYYKHLEEQQENEEATARAEASADALVSLLENEYSGHLYDLIESGRADEGQINEFTQLATAAGVIPEDLEAILAAGRDRASQTERVQDTPERSEEAPSADEVTPTLPAQSSEQLGFVEPGLSQQESRLPPRAPDQREQLLREEQARQAAANPLRAAALKTLEEIRRRGMTVDDYARQEVLFGEKPTDAEIELLKELEAGENESEQPNQQATFFSEAKPVTGKPNLAEWATRLKSIIQAKDLEGLTALSDEMAAHKDDPRVAQLQAAIQSEIERVQQTAPLFSRAYHGSPHAFDRFRTEKIGSGEGAQAYGYGLYFTDRKEIADYYRKNLGPGRGSAPSDIAARIYDALPEAWSDERKNEAVVRELERRKTDAGPDATEFHATMDKAISSVQSGSHKGRLYVVELAPKEDEYLLWDEPLSKQSDKVRAAIEKAFNEPPEGVDRYEWKKKLLDAEYLDSKTENALGGLYTYHAISDLMDKPETMEREGYPRGWGFAKRGDEGQKAASQYLHSLGVRGIKYLDQGSRPQTYRGDSAYLAAAISFRNDGQNSDAALTGMKQAYPDATPQELQHAVNEAYGENKGASYNYVIFSDADVEILQQFARGWLGRMFSPGEKAQASVEGNRVSMNAAAARILSDIYRELGHVGSVSKGVRGAYERKGYALASNFGKLADRGVKGARTLADVVHRAAKNGEGKVVLFYGEGARRHELFHETSERSNRDLNDRHGDIEGLTTAPQWERIQQWLTREGGYPNQIPVLVEEAAAHIAEGRYEQMGLSREEAIDWMELWFKSFAQKNPDVSVREFKELADAAEKARERVYETQSRTFSQPDKTVPRLEGRGAEGDRANLARAPDITGNRGTFDPNDPNILLAREPADPWERLSELAEDFERLAREPKSPNARPAQAATLGELDTGDVNPRVAAPDPILSDADPAEAHAMALSSMRMPVSDVAEPGYEKSRVSAAQVIKSYEAILTSVGRPAPIRTGRIAQRDVRGIYKPDAEVIRLKTANNIPTAAHETGHALQKVIYGSTESVSLVVPGPVKRELVNLGKALYGSRKPAGGYRTEGFAEFMRYYLTRDDVTTVAPETTKLFEGTILPAHPAIAKAINEARTKTDSYRKQGAKARGEANIEKLPGAIERGWQKVNDAFRRFPKAWIDEFTPLFHLSKFAAGKTGPLPASQDPAVLASALRATAGAKVAYMVNEGMIDFAGNVVGPPLRDATSIVKGKEKDFALYLHAKRAQERWSKDKNPGMSREDADALVAQLETPEFQLAAQKVYDWNDGILSYVEQAVPSMAEAIKKIRSESQFYVPLQRSFAPEEVKGSKGGGAVGGNALKQMKGSGRAVKEIFPQILQNAEQMLSKAHKRAVLDAIVRLSDIEGLGHLVEEVPKDRAPITITAEQAADALRGLGYDVDDTARDELVTFFTPSQFPKGQTPIIPLMRDGQMKWYQVDPEVYNTLAGIDLFRLHPLLDLIFGVPTRIFRLGVTGLRPAFSLLTNPMRDVQTFIMQSKSHKNPAHLAAIWVSEMARAFNPARLAGRRDPFLDLFERLGAQVSQPLGVDIAATRRVSKELFHGKVMNTVTHPLTMVRELLSLPESASRTAELRAIADEIGWKPGQPLTLDQSIEMTLAAKRVTTDFSAGGHLGKMFNQAVPFFNANIQGTRSFARTVKENPRRALLRGLLLITVPTLFLWWKNKDKEWYRDMLDRDRFTYWHIQSGNQIIRIPKAFEWGNLFAVAPEAIFDSWYQKDPAGTKAALSQIFESSVPDVLPVPFKAAKEQWQNSIEFFNKPIVPRGELDLPASEQRGPYTSAVATWLGRHLPDAKVQGIPINSPRRIDALIRSFGGGVAPDVLNAVGLGGQRGVRENEPSDLPVIGRLFRPGGIEGMSSKAMDSFYDRLSDANARAGSKDQPETAVQREDRLLLEDANKAIQVLRLIQLETPALADRQGIARMSRLIAATAQDQKLTPEQRVEKMEQVLATRPDVSEKVGEKVRAKRAEQKERRRELGQQDKNRADFNLPGESSGRRRVGPPSPPRPGR